MASIVSAERTKEKELPCTSQERRTAAAAAADNGVEDNGLRSLVAGGGLAATATIATAVLYHSTVQKACKEIKSSNRCLQLATQK